jgi:hypothetical protein
MNPSFWDKIMSFHAKIRSFHAEDSFLCVKSNIMAKNQQNLIFYGGTLIMKKIFLFMVVIVSLFTFVACSGGSIEEGHTDAEAKVDAEVNQEQSEEQIRIDENNAVILPKLTEIEKSIMDIETIVADHDLGEEYQSAVDTLKEHLRDIADNHQKIIDMGGYLGGTDEFVAVLDGVIENNQNILDLMIYELEYFEKRDKLIDKENELIDLVNTVVVSAQANGWEADEFILSEIGAVYSFMDEVQLAIEGSEVIEETYMNEKFAQIDQLIPLFQDYLVMVSVPYVE